MKIPNLRWLIAGALCLAAVLNYIDRGVLGLLAPTIQADLKISDEQYAMVINFFLVAYTFAYLASGAIVDKLGVRVSLALFIVWWSISNALTGFAQSVRSLSVFRFMLGLGEAGGFTASPKAVSEWFPPSERGIAVGIYSVGGALGSTIAPVLVWLIAERFGWRWVFAVSPIFAGCWLVLWLWLYRKPAEHPHITEKERAYLAAEMEPAAADSAAEEVSGAARWSLILRQPFVWQLMLARLMTDPVWYFFQYWMPKYLHAEFGLSQKGLSVMSVISLAADAGFLLGGFFAGRFILHGAAPPNARVRMMLISAGLVPLALLVPFAQSVAGAVLICMVIAYALTAWLSNLTSLVVDITPKPILGTAFGVIACGSGIGGILMNQAVAWMVTHRSYADCFFVMALAHPLRSWSSAISDGSRRARRRIEARSAGWRPGIAGASKQQLTAPWRGSMAASCPAARDPDNKLSGLFHAARGSTVAAAAALDEDQQREAADHKRPRAGLGHDFELAVVEVQLHPVVVCRGCDVVAVHVIHRDVKRVEDVGARFRGTDTEHEAVLVVAAGRD